MYEMGFAKFYSVKEELEIKIETHFYNFLKNICLNVWLKK
jgi:hypothetical protein